MYQRHVRRSALFVLAIIDSSEASAPGTSSTRLSIGGAGGRPDLAAPARWYLNRSSCPAFTHVVGSRAKPLSNTDTSELDPVATRHGEHSSAGWSGSPLRS